MPSAACSTASTACYSPAARRTWNPIIQLLGVVEDGVLVTDAASLAGGGARPLNDRDDAGPPPTQRQRDAADVLAAAVRQLLTVDHGFADAPRPFTDVYVGDALSGRAGAPLEPLQRERITAALNELGATAQFVDDPDGLLQTLFADTTAGIAVIVIDALDLWLDGAVIELHYWCTLQCVVFVSYEVASVDGEWTITGLAGPIAMS